MTGETDELFAKLTGAKKNYPWRCKCGTEVASGAYHECYMNKRDRRPRLENQDELEAKGWVFGSVEEFFNSDYFIQTGTVSNEPEGKTTVSGSCDFTAPSGWVCQCGEFVTFGEGHSCRFHMAGSYAPGATNLEPTGCECVFCGGWVETGEVHLCLYDKSQQMLQLQEIQKRLDRIEKNQEILAKGIKRILNRLGEK